MPRLFHVQVAATHLEKLLELKGWMRYLEEEEDEQESECRRRVATQSQLSRHIFVIICYGVGFLGPGCGHTALLPSVLQRSPELCHGGTMTTTLKQESENH